MFPLFTIIQVLINDRFAQFSESLYIADRHAREEVRQRSLMQQRIAEKEKESKEDGLRALAQRARDERAGIVSSSSGMPVTGARSGGMGLADYGSDDDSASEQGGAIRAAADTDDEEEEEDEERGDVEGAKERAELRKERKKEREREMRMSNMGTEQRAKILAR